jgi:hypothetical protein
VPPSDGRIWLQQAGAAEKEGRGGSQTNKQNL